MLTILHTGKALAIILPIWIFGRIPGSMIPQKKILDCVFMFTHNLLQIIIQTNTQPATRKRSRLR
jgi:hypothetical protein